MGTSGRTLSAATHCRSLPICVSVTSRASTSEENSASAWKTTCTSRKTALNCLRRKVRAWKILLGKLKDRRYRRHRATSPSWGLGTANQSRAVLRDAAKIARSSFALLFGGSRAFAGALIRCPRASQAKRLFHQPPQLRLPSLLQTQLSTLI